MMAKLKGHVRSILRKRGKREISLEYGKVKKITEDEECLLNDIKRTVKCRTYYMIKTLKFSLKG